MSDLGLQTDHKNSFVVVSRAIEGSWPILSNVVLLVLKWIRVSNF